MTVSSVCKDTEHANRADFVLPVLRKVTYQYTPMTNNSHLAAEVDEFLDNFERQHRTKI